jgi:hypothetical protein
MERAEQIGTDLFVEGRNEVIFAQNLAEEGFS